MKLVIVSLLLTAVAAAEPTPPPAAACAEKGTPIFEIDHSAIKDAKVPTSATQVFDSGAWRTTGSDETGKATTPQTGCLGKDVLDKLRADLKAASWKITHHKIHCMMVAQTFTVYKAGGKQVWTAKACNADALDDASTKALADIETQLVAAKLTTK